MAKVGKGRQLKSSTKKHRVHPYLSSHNSHKVAKDIYNKKHCKTSDDRDWEDVTCSVCMESPHNAVLLLCSSYGNGCRPYMCATSYRFSNCLDQYKKTYTKLNSLQSAQSSSEVLGSGWPHEKDQVPQLSCPICRGQVKGWTVVEQARADLNKKTRSCMQDNCSFVGDYKQLRKHVKASHPLSRPRDVDPALEEKWRTLERERERNDVISAITSSDPSAVVFGDFVIEGNQNPAFYINYDNVGGFLDENYFRIDPFMNNRTFGGRLGLLSERRIERLQSLFDDADDSAPAGNNDNDALPVSHRNRQLLFGRINPRTRNTES